MIIPTTKPNATREDYIRAWMDGFRMSREAAEAETQLHVDMGLFVPADSARASSQPQAR